MARSYSIFVVPAMLVVLAAAIACSSNGEPATAAPAGEDRWSAARAAMVEEQIEGRGITDEDVLAAMREVPRHAFVPASLADVAYEDRALPIGYEQTISQPYVVALMTELAGVDAGDKVLEVGTGSGYQAAVLAALGARVFTIEIVRPLGERAARTLEELGYERVETRIGDGYAGWPEQAPFDAVVVTAAPPEIPQPLIDQLRVGGKLVIPVGDRTQKLLVVTKAEDGVERREVLPVLFVPMTGEAQAK